MSEGLKDLNDFQSFVEKVGSGNLSDAKKILTQSSIPLPLKEYNLSYLAYSEGQLVQALKHLEKAQFNGFLTPESILAKKQIANELGIQHIENSLSPINQFFVAYKLMPQAAHFSLLIVIIFVTLFSFFFKRKILSALTTLFLVICLSISIYLNFLDLKYITKEAPLYLGPSRIFEQITVIPAGVKILAHQEKNYWMKIEYPKEFSGWIYIKDQNEHF